MKSGKDIAAETGYSLSTVMKVLGGHSKNYKIGAEAERKILACAEMISYHRSEAAATTRTGISHTVAVALYNKSFDSSKEALSGIMREAAARSYGISTFIDSEPEKMIAFLLSRRIKHLISTALDRSTRERTARICRENDIRLVFIYEASCGGYPAVNTDNFNGMRSAVKFLTDHGHRKIVLCCNYHNYVYDVSRHDGYIAALSEAGIKPEKKYLFCRDINNHAEIAERMLNLPPERRPTAFVSTTDTDSILFANAFVRAGLRVPEDISLFGFGNARFTELAIVRLSSVAIDSVGIGSVALRVLLNENVPCAPDAGGNYLLPPTLVIRDSVYDLFKHKTVGRGFVK